MSLDSTIKELMAALQAKAAPEAYDTQATVTRVEDDTIWVHIPGGVDETPVRKTVSASPGDEIQIRVGGGRAWAVGNATAPPTDDRQANLATEKAEDNAKAIAEMAESVKKAGASIEVLDDQIHMVVTEVEGKNTTYHQGRTTNYRQLLTKAGVPIYTKAGAPVYGKTQEPPTPGLNIDADHLTVGDLWYNTNEDNAVYRWDGTAWESVRDLQMSEISQKLDSITLRVVGADGVTSEIRLNDQGQINLLGSVLAQRIAVDELMARDITATGSFQVDTDGYYLITDSSGFQLGYTNDRKDAQKPGSAISANNSGVRITTSTGSVTISAPRGSVTIYTPAAGLEVIGRIDANYIYVDGNKAIARQNKTVTGTTDTNGTIALSLNVASYGILNIRDTTTARICLPYCTPGGAWRAKVLGYAGMSAVASTEVTLSVDYYAI